MPPVLRHRCALSKTQISTCHSKAWDLQRWWKSTESLAWVRKASFSTSSATYPRFPHHSISALVSWNCSPFPKHASESLCLYIFWFLCWNCLSHHLCPINHHLGNTLIVPRKHKELLFRPRLPRGIANAECIWKLSKVWKLEPVSCEHFPGWSPSLPTHLGHSSDLEDVLTFQGQMAEGIENVYLRKT